MPFKLTRQLRDGWHLMTGGRVKISNHIHVITLEVVPTGERFSLTKWSDSALFADDSKSVLAAVVL